MRMRFIEPFDDREGLGEHVAVNGEGRDEALWVYAEIGLFILFTPPQMDGYEVGFDPFKVEGNPATVGSRAAEVAIKSHAIISLNWRTAACALATVLAKPYPR
jgi:hypothetical protein